MIVLETERLRLRRLVPEDAAFILRLFNEPSWLRFIGDRGIRTLDAAEDYIRTGPMAMYDRLGFGLYAVEPKGGGDAMGICGLIKRDALEDVDVGFALLPEFWSKGYAYEAAAATMEYAKAAIGLGRIAAIVSPGNDASIALLGKLGLKYERLVRMTPESPEIQLFAIDFPSTTRTAAPGSD